MGIEGWKLAWLDDGDARATDIDRMHASITRKALLGPAETPSRAAVTLAERSMPTRTSHARITWLNQRHAWHRGRYSEILHCQWQWGWPAFPAATVPRSHNSSLATRPYSSPPPTLPKFHCLQYGADRSRRRPRAGAYPPATLRCSPCRINTGSRESSSKCGGRQIN